MNLEVCRFPLIPDASPENNRFVANICSGEDWPALTATRKLYTPVCFFIGVYLHLAVIQLPS